MADLAGLWAGRLRGQGGDEPLLVRFVREGDRLSGTLDLSARLLFDVAIHRLRQSDHDLDWEADAGRLSVHAHIAGDTIDGRAAVDGEERDVLLHRVAAAPELGQLVGEWQVGSRSLLIARLRDRLLSQTVYFYAEDDALVRLYPLQNGTLLSARGESIAPTSNGRRARRYESRDVSFRGPAGRLRGSLLVPPKPRGAVVLLHGTIPGERDYYRVFGRHFAHHDVAALIYDRRGSGSSEGPDESTIFDRADDAGAAIAYLRDQGFPAVGVWAFSNGGWSAPIVARRDPDVAFLIAFGAAGVTIAEAEVHRRVCELRLAGVSERSLEAVARCWQLIFRYVSRGALANDEREELGDALAAVRADAPLASVPVPEFARANPALAAVPPWTSSSELPPVTGPDRELAHDPCTDYRRLTMPVLFTIGELDQNIPPQTSVRRVAEALEASGNHRSRVEIVPGAGHELNVEPPPAARAPLFSFQLFRFAPGLLDRVAGWAAQQL
jgi:alpha-beta hydrolase superfamily lysophospholipase